MRTRVYRWIGLALAAAGAAAAAEGQELERLARAANGTVTFAYPAAANVCGTGDGVLIREPDGSTTFISGRLSSHDWRAWRSGDPPCRTGHARVRMTRSHGGWTGIRVAVGADGHDDGPRTRHLGYFTGQDAADFLLAAAVRSDTRAARELILAAAIADDAVTWPMLLAMARDRTLASATRRSAMHWLGRQAAREAVDALGGILRDRTEADEIREAAIFALSQLPDDQAVPILIHVVRTMGDDPRLVNRALFWLAGFDDPRAVAVFEEILAAPGATP
jgi:hypothetical protein